MRRGVHRTHSCRQPSSRPDQLPDYTAYCLGSKGEQKEVNGYCRQQPALLSGRNQSEYSQSVSSASCSLYRPASFCIRRQSSGKEILPCVRSRTPPTAAILQPEVFFLHYLESLGCLETAKALFALCPGWRGAYSRMVVCTAPRPSPFFCHAFALLPQIWISSFTRQRIASEAVAQRSNTLSPCRSVSRIL